MNVQNLVIKSTVHTTLQNILFAKGLPTGAKGVGDDVTTTIWSMMTVNEQ